ncbi:MAG: DUF4389 domain-containing protein [Methylococcaceae bacterium]|nr:DUF4389 domain-containing protein [Methylococcaceae bacterium]
MQEYLNSDKSQIIIWKRLLYMLIYGILAGLVRMLIWVVILIQLGTVIFTGEVNQHLLNFGQRLSAFLYHMLLFLTFNTDDLAFPFASWGLTKEPELLKPRSKV